MLVPYSILYKQCKLQLADVRGIPLSAVENSQAAIQTYLYSHTGRSYCIILAPPPHSDSLGSQIGSRSHEYFDLIS